MLDLIALLRNSGFPLFTLSVFFFKIYLAYIQAHYICQNIPNAFCEDGDCI